MGGKKSRLYNWSGMKFGGARSEAYEFVAMVIAHQCIISCEYDFILQFGRSRNQIELRHY